MKTETLTIPAREVKAGDVTPWGTVEDAGQYAAGMCEQVYFTILGADVIADLNMKITVTRPVADVRPRGRMDIDFAGCLCLNGARVMHLAKEQRNLIEARIAELWNAAESGPTRAELVEMLQRVRDWGDFDFDATARTLRDEIDALLGRFGDVK